MSRPISAAVLRVRQAQQQEPWTDHGYRDDTADSQQDEAAIAAAPALACGYLGEPNNRIYIFRAQVQTPCLGCHGTVQPEALFSSYYETPDVAVKYATCATCRPVRVLAPKGIA